MVGQESLCAHCLSSLIIPLHARGHWIRCCSSSASCINWQAGSAFIKVTAAFAGVFVYGYCFYYFLARSEMSGFMQTSESLLPRLLLPAIHHSCCTRSHCNRMCTLLSLTCIPWKHPGRCCWPPGSYLACKQHVSSSRPVCLIGKYLHRCKLVLRQVSTSCTWHASASGFS